MDYSETYIARVSNHDWAVSLTTIAIIVASLNSCIGLNIYPFNFPQVPILSVVFQHFALGILAWAIFVPSLFFFSMRSVKRRPDRSPLASTVVVFVTGGGSLVWHERTWEHALYFDGPDYVREVTSWNVAFFLGLLTLVGLTWIAPSFWRHYGSNLLLTTWLLYFAFPWFAVEHPPA